MAKTTADYLNEVADLLSGEKAWTKGTFARDEQGQEVDPDSNHAICWCIHGAIERVVPFADADPVKSTLQRVVGYFLADYNDTHTQSEVVAACRKAAELAQ